MNSIYSSFPPNLEWNVKLVLGVYSLLIQKGDPVLDFYILTDIWNHSLGRVGKSLDGFGNKGQIPRSLLWRKLYRN